MQDLEEVRARIAKRKAMNSRRQVLGDRQFNYLYRFAITTMSLCVFILGLASYAKQNPKVAMYLKENLDFSKASTWIDDHVLSVIPFFDWQEDVPVAVNEVYEVLDNGQYRGNSSTIHAVYSGIVTSLGENQVIISQDNGVQAVYEDLSEVQIQLYDHVRQGDNIGAYEGQFGMKFTKDGQEVSYEEAAKD